MKQKNTNMVVFCVIKADTFPIKKRAFYSFVFFKNKKNPKDPVEFLGNSGVCITGDH